MDDNQKRAWDLDKRILWLRSTGMTYKEIGSILKLSTGHISNKCKELGAIKGPRSESKQSTKRRIIETHLREGLLTPKEIAEHVGVTKQYISLIRKGLTDDIQRAVE